MLSFEELPRQWRAFEIRGIIPSEATFCVALPELLFEEGSSGILMVFDLDVWEMPAADLTYRALRSPIAADPFDGSSDIWSFERCDRDIVLAMMQLALLASYSFLFLDLPTGVAVQVDHDQHLIAGCRTIERARSLSNRLSDLRVHNSIEQT